MQKQMKKVAAFLLALVMIASTLCGGALSVSAESETSSEGETLISSEATVEGETPEESETSVANEISLADAEYTEYLPETQPDGFSIKALAAQGVFPEGTIMMVTSLDSESEEYAEASENLTNNGISFDGFQALDISFYDASGNAIEPQDGSVQLQMDLDISMFPEEVDAETLAIQHLDESTGEIQVETVADVSDKTEGAVTVNDESVIADFTVDSFSTFTLTWNNSSRLSIQCVDVNYIEIGTDSENSISASTAVTELAPEFEDYKFLRAEYGRDGNVITHLERGGTGRQTYWQYSSDNGSNWERIYNTTVYFVYEKDTSPRVTISQTVSGDTVELTANTKNFSATPTFEWSISGNTDAVEFDPVNHTVTWKANATENAEVTVTVAATNSNGERATTSLTLVNQFATITYNPNTAFGGSGSIKTAKYRVGEVITIPGNDFGFTNTAGRTFAGWGTETYTDSQETNKVYTPEQKYIVTEDVTLYAQWMDANATVDHVHIRVEGLIFSRTVQITDGSGNIISEATQTFTGKVTKVNGVTITGDSWEETFGESSSNNGYEFRVGNFRNGDRDLDSVQSVVVYVDILGDDGTVLENQKVEFTQAQIYAAWANCGSSGSSKGLDFNISDSNIQLEVQKIPARLIVTKDFKNLNEEHISQLEDFVIDVNGQKLTVNDPVQTTVTINGEEVTIVKAIESDGSYVWAMTNLPTGNYTVTERGGEKVGSYLLHSYKWVSSEYGNSNFTNEGSTKTTTVTLGEGDVKLVAFTNTYGKQQGEITLSKKVVIDGREVEASALPENVNYTFAIYKIDDGVASENPVKTITLPYGSNELSAKLKLEVGTYRIVEQTGETAGYKYIGTTNKVNADSDKNGLTTTDFELTKDGVTVTYTNSYKQIKEVSISKTVSGSMGDRNKDFTFTITVNGKKISGTYNGITITDGRFTLKHDESLTITGLYKGDKVVVTEDDYSKDGYATTVNEVTGSECEVILSDATTNIGFVNTKDVIPPTGITFTTLPFALMILFAGLGAAFFFAKRRRTN